MSPATHAVVGAALADSTRRVWLAIPLAFASHFVCDSIYHFEAFYPLSRLLGTTYEGAFAAAAAVMALLLLPVLWLLNRGGRGLGALYVYAAATSTVMVFDDWRVRGALALLIAGLFLIAGSEVRFAHWIVGALSAQLPDLIREGIRPLNRFHIFMHYDGTWDLGQIFYHLVHGEPGLHTNVRFENPYYVTGYVVEVLIEVGIVVGLLYYLRGPSRSPE
jgi:hypothetical protein